MAERRVFAGYYKRCDGKPIFVVRVLRDIDTGEAIVVCKGASFPLCVLLRKGRGRRRAAGQICAPDPA